VVAGEWPIGIPGRVTSGPQCDSRAAFLERKIRLLKKFVVQQHGGFFPRTLKKSAMFSADISAGGFKWLDPVASELHSVARGHYGADAHDCEKFRSTSVSERRATPPGSIHFQPAAGSIRRSGIGKEVQRSQAFSILLFETISFHDAPIIRQRDRDNRRDRGAGPRTDFPGPGLAVHQGGLFQ